MRLSIFLGWTFFIAILLCCSCKTDSQQLTQKQKDELKLVIDKFNAAFANSDIEIIDSFIVENYVHTNGSSKAIDRKKWFNYLDSRNGDIASGRLKINSYKMENIQFEFFGKASVVTAKVSTSIDENGEIKKSEYRVTNLWTYTDTGWKRAAFHDGKIK